jgi:hypothetical protein
MRVEEPYINFPCSTIVSSYLSIVVTQWGTVLVQCIRFIAFFLFTYLSCSRAYGTVLCLV